MSQPPSGRFEAALGSEHPFDGLVCLAKLLRDEGVTQREMYDLFDRHRAIHHEDGDERRYDAILDVMDLIVGWCSHHARLFDTDPMTSHDGLADPPALAREHCSRSEGLNAMRVDWCWASTREHPMLDADEFAAVYRPFQEKEAGI